MMKMIKSLLFCAIRLKNKTAVAAVALLVATLCGCNGWRDPHEKVATLPPIFPDYIGVTVPRNIAPPNFEISGASRIQALLTAGDEELRVIGDRYVDIDIEDWRILQAAALKNDGKISVCVSVWTEQDIEGVEYKPFDIIVSEDEVDAWVAYRLIPPGYESWCRMGIYERNLESFDERAIITNDQNNKGCVNCHSFAQYDAENGMVFHARGIGGGTVVYQNGVLDKIALETMGLQMSGTYPMWHPQGRFVVFSSNKTRQSFYAHSRDKIEVYDQGSDLMIYDSKNKDVLTDERFTDSLNWETFPAFSPDGRWLYFCTAKPVKMPAQYDQLHYSIVRVPFDCETGRLGAQIDTVYNANKQGGSASFPRISPDGRWLMFTLADCGTFPIHHKEADLRLLDLTADATPVMHKIDNINSPDVDSYHSWSSNGRWVILSSKRVDGSYTRLFLAHWDGKHFTKPMLLPQRDPKHNVQRLYSYNIPEFIKSPVIFDSDEIAELFKMN